MSRDVDAKEVMSVPKKWSLTAPNVVEVLAVIEAKVIMLSMRWCTHRQMPLPVSCLDVKGIWIPKRWCRYQRSEASRYQVQLELAGPESSCPCRQWEMHSIVKCLRVELPWCEGDVDTKEMMPVPKKWSLTVPSTSRARWSQISLSVPSVRDVPIVKCLRVRTALMSRRWVSRKCSWSTRCLGVLSITISPAGSQHEVHVLEMTMMHLECTFTFPRIHTGATCAHWFNPSALSTQLGALYYQRCSVLSAYHHGHNADHITSSLQTDTIR